MRGLFQDLLKVNHERFPHILSFNDEPQKLSPLKDLTYVYDLNLLSHGIYTKPTITLFSAHVCCCKQLEYTSMRFDQGFIQ